MKGENLMSEYDAKYRSGLTRILRLRIFFIVSAIAVVPLAFIIPFIFFEILNAQVSSDILLLVMIPVLWTAPVSFMLYGFAKCPRCGKPVHYDMDRKEYRGMANADKFLSRLACVHCDLRFRENDKGAKDAKEA